MWGKCYESGKIFKLLSEAYGLTWSGGIAAEVIDGCPVTLKEDRYYVQVSAYMPERYMRRNMRSSMSR